MNTRTRNISTAAAVLASLAIAGTGAAIMQSSVSSERSLSSTTQQQKQQAAAAAKRQNSPTAQQTPDPGQSALNALVKRQQGKKLAAAPSLASAAVSAPQVLPNPDDATGDDTRAAYKGSASQKVSAGVSTRNASYAKASNNAPAPTSLKANRVYVPSVGINGSVIPEKVTGKFLNVPTKSWRAGWYNESAPLDATSGNTVIAGHVGLSKVPGVFANLGSAKIGSIVYLSDKNAKVHAYRIVSKNLYNKEKVPDSVFYPLVDRAVTLMTCGGEEGKTAGSDGAYYGHLDNVVVQAVPVEMK